MIFRKLTDELRTLGEGLVGSLDSLTEGFTQLDGRFTDTAALEARVKALEVTVAKQYADAEALFKKADAKLKAANASEARERRLATEADVDESLTEEQLEALSDRLRSEGELAAESDEESAGQTLEELRDASRRIKFG